MTSVKEVRVEEPPDGGAGRGRFVFTDAYSVFDWGRMPDPVPGKGAALCTTGAFNFELLDVNHVPSHYRGVYEEPDAASEPLDLGDCESPPRAMAVDLVRTPELPYADGAYDYDAFHAAAGDAYLVPLEVVFRNRIPPASSLRDRAAPSEYGVDADGDEWPEGVVELPEPAVEFSTKFEETDRYLARAEAERVAGAAELDRLEELALAVNHVVTRQAERCGMVHEDGKLECLYDDGAIRVADVVGTLDENRFSYDGQRLSKEVLRQYHRREQPEWVEAVAAAKREADERDVADWRSLCAVEPEPLPGPVLETAADLYAAATDAYTGSDWFDAPSLASVVERVRAL
jgi:phosphoribosylaminoimidazole-succinocarboxamide synthase